MDETLLCHREIDNSEDMYAVAFYKSEEIVGFERFHICAQDEVEHCGVL